MPKERSYRNVASSGSAWCVACMLACPCLHDVATMTVSIFKKTLGSFQRQVGDSVAALYLGAAGRRRPRSRRAPQTPSFARRELRFRCSRVPTSKRDMIWDVVLRRFIPPRSPRNVRRTPRSSGGAVDLGPVNQKKESQEHVSTITERCSAPPAESTISDQVRRSLRCSIQHRDRVGALPSGGPESTWRASNTVGLALRGPGDGHPPMGAPRKTTYFAAPARAASPAAARSSSNWKRCDCHGHARLKIRICLAQERGAKGVHLRVRKRSNND